ncbi:hypothetical protein L207DRAFT_506231 [Hyaloscypha variabilis F]|uniref:Uncharacterized protein n=1 Tax=Hyaloscypha variabilis (strain UAMH 11265 / GT02V1 / F) TaxID=1149755 RepID=A0A2J6S8Z1_HYAVF|nr:hypothetical protein L207DRAFT_506231 [Hyaloscypha variabilis F]
MMCKRCSVRKLASSRAQTSVTPTCRGAETTRDHAHMPPPARTRDIASPSISSSPAASAHRPRENWSKHALTYLIAFFFLYSSPLAAHLSHETPNKHKHSIRDSRSIRERSDSEGAPTPPMDS